MPPKVVGHYGIARELGRGGMGIVYVARDLLLDREVALKRPTEECVRNPDQRRRFLREAKAASSLSHPSIVTIYETFEQDGVPWIAMALIKGRSLREALGAGPAFRMEAVLDHAEAIGGALQAAHQRDLLHRDVNPNNILIDDQGNALLADFGLARHSLAAEVMSAATTESFGPTAQGARVGTPGYMSPEQAAGGDVDARSDLFSLGVVLHEMCTGRRPFYGVETGDVRSSMLERHAAAQAGISAAAGTGTSAVAGAGTPTAARVGTSASAPVDPGCLAELERIVHKSVAQRPGDRYQSAGDLLADLRALRRRIDSAEYERLHPRGWLTRLWIDGRWVAGRWTAASLAVAAVAAVVIGLAWNGWWRAPAPPPSTVRPAVAVMPFEFRSNGGDDSGRGAMVADLIAAAVGESGRLRAVAPDRIEEILSGAGGSGAGGSAADGAAAGSATGAAAERSRLVDRVRQALSPDWLVTGSLYDEDGQILATVWLYKGSSRREAGSFQVRGRRFTEVASQAAARLFEATGAPPVAGFAGGRPLPRFATVDEAQVLAHGARQLTARSDYGQAIAKLEQAIALDAGFVDAHALLADLFDRVGYEGRARESIQRSVRLIAEQGLPSESRQALLVAAVQGRLLGLPAALESLRRLADLYPDEPDTLLAFAYGLHRAGRDDEAAIVVDKAAALDPRDPRPLLARGRVQTAQGHTEEAAATLAEAERRYRRLGSGVGMAEVYEARAYLRYQEKSYADAESDYRLAGDQFRKMGLPTRALRANQSIADMRLMLWRLDEAETQYRATLAGLQEAGWYSQAVDTLAGLGGLLMRRGRMREAETTLKQADDEARKLGNELLRVTPLINLANVYCFSGRPAAAIRAASEAEEIARAANDADSVASARGLIALADQIEGRVEKAIATFRDLAAEAERDGNPARQGYVLGQIAEAQEWAEQPAAALATVDQAIKMLEPLGPSMRLAYRLGCRARLLATFGRHEEAARDFARIDSMVTRERGLPQLRDMIQTTRATLAMAQGRFAEVLEIVPAGSGGAAAGSGSALTGSGKAAASEADERASFYRGFADILRAEARLQSGDAAGAAEDARRAFDHPAAARAEKVAAALVRSRALGRTGRAPAALEQARLALVEARTLGLPLSEGRAAAIVVRLEAAGPVAGGKGEGHPAAGQATRDPGETIRAGRAALRRYLDAIPSEAQSFVRARPEVRETIDVLGD